MTNDPARASSLALVTTAQSRAGMGFLAGEGMPDPEILREFFRYEPETGCLFWRARSAEWFGGSPAKAAAWNFRCADKPAFTALNSSGYRHGTIWHRNFRAHRVIWAIVHGSWPDIIDHIDGDRLNNRIANLRSVTCAENARNTARPSHSTAPQVGVRQTIYGTWEAKISADRKAVYLGTFPTFQQALAIRKEAEQRLGYHPNHGRPHSCTASGSGAPQ